MWIWSSLDRTGLPLHLSSKKRRVYQTTYRLLLWHREKNKNFHCQPLQNTSDKQDWSEDAPFPNSDFSLALRWRFYFSSYSPVTRLSICLRYLSSFKWSTAPTRTIWVTVRAGVKMRQQLFQLISVALRSVTYFFCFSHHLPWIQNFPWSLKISDTEKITVRVTLNDFGEG